MRPAKLAITNRVTVFSSSAGFVFGGPELYSAASFEQLLAAGKLRP